MALRRPPTNPHIVEAIVSTPLHLGWQTLADVSALERVKLHCLLKYLYVCPDADLSSAHFRAWLQQSNGLVGNFWQQAKRQRKTVIHG